MHYELLHQLIFSNLEQTDGFGRKLVVYILNAFTLEFKTIELIIESKLFKWSNDGGVYPAQHIIFLKSNIRKYQLFSIEDPWPCNKVSLKKQIHFWRSRMIVRDLDYEIYSFSNYKLITEDNIQKIISANIFLGVLLLFQNHFSYLVDKYKKDYVQEKQARKEFEKNSPRDAQLKRFQESFVELYLCTFVSLYLSNKKRKKEEERRVHIRCKKKKTIEILLNSQILFA